MEFHCVMANYGYVQPKTVQLIQEIEKHPLLYDQKLRSTRNARRKIWDTITEKCGYAKTEETKNKWRALTAHLRHHIWNVEKKTLRRYIPKTDNPEDQYVQLEDWHYYKYIKYMVPHIKPRKPRPSRYIARRPTDDTPKTSTENPAKETPAKLQKTQSPSAKEQTPEAIDVNQTPLQVEIDDVVFKVELDDLDTAQANSPNRIEIIESNTSSTTPPSHRAESQENTLNGQSINESNTSLPLEANGFQQLSIDEQNLKSFFDAMLCSTQLLPKYHQERIKRRLLHVINAQKKLNTGF